MITEQGKVIASDGRFAEVEVKRGGLCQRCEARQCCSPLDEGGLMKVTALNQGGARVGDRVILGIEERAFLRGTFLVYIVPLIALFAGAFIGVRFADPFGRGWSAEVTSVIFGVLGLLLGLAGIGLYSRTADSRAAYMPRIVEVSDKDTGEESLPGARTEPLPWNM